jgi:uncharacterized protein (DUF58 family)
LIFSKRWMLLFAAGVVPLLLTGVSPGYVRLAQGWYVALVVLALTDWLLFPDLDMLKVEREADDRMAVGSESPVRVRVRNESPVGLDVELRDTPPDDLSCDLPPEPFRFRVTGHGRHAAVYHVTPRSRGAYRFGDVFLRVRGRLGMVLRLRRLSSPLTVKVYPSLRETARFTLMARRGRLRQMGIRAARLQGVGREFESLRDYQPDDEMRRIDWKATARRGRLVARQYEVERSQNVILALDIGRTMLAEIDGVQKLDYAINAALLLAYVATLTDDNVGLLVFSDTVRTFLPPRRGRAQVFAILDAVYDLKASLADPDYRGAMGYLEAHWRRRSLLVCFTDLWDPDSSRHMISELAALQQRHLVAAVTLLDSTILRAASAGADSAEAMYKKAAAVQLLEDRQRAMSALAQRGVLVVDSPAEKLSAELVSRYLDVKERMLL